MAKKLLSIILYITLIATTILPVAGDDWLPSYPIAGVDDFLKSLPDLQMKEGGDIDYTNRPESQDEYDFVIIASNEWYEYDGTWDLERLKDWHNQNDTLTTYIVNLADILGEPLFWVNGTWGDGNPDNPYKRLDEDPITNYAMFNDSAAKVRNYIRYAHYELGVTYALLVGDTDDFPYRQLYAHGYGAPAGLDNIIDNIPADMYFGCLDGTFNDDEDTYISGQHIGWGENETYNANGIDEVDWEYEVAIGRFCLDTPEELSNCVRKTIAYMELDGTEEYLYNCTGAGHGTGWGGQAEWAVNYSKQLNGSTETDWGHLTYGFDPEVYTWTWINPHYVQVPGDIDYTDNNVNNTINNGTHIFVQGGHGWQGGFSTAGYPPYGEDWRIEDVQNLTNTKYFLVLTSTNCQCGRFDADDCISEVFMNDEHGAFASIMNSRSGWGSDDSPEHQHGLHSTGHYAIREFFDAYFNPSERYTRIGDMLYDAKRDCDWLRYQDDKTIRFTNFEKNLIGSPAVQMKFPILYKIHNIDKNLWYQTIQEAIYEADPGDSIFVNNGTFYEHIVVNKAIQLIGENKDSAIIDGGGSGEVVFVSADGVHLASFTIQNGIRGVNLQYSSNCNISGNIIVNNDYGIYLYKSYDNNLAENVVIKNRWRGIYLYNSSNNLINKNRIFNITWYGIFLQESYNNILTENTIENNRYGFYLYKKDSPEEGDTEFNNQVYHNNFIDNIIYNAYDKGINKYNDGNYWSDYDESSEGAYDIWPLGAQVIADGRIDSGSYNIPPNGENKDPRPWIELDGWYKCYGPDCPQKKSTLELLSQSVEPP